jgi:O-acetyl-ADP-ribose deacetylase (regulator of RNase III)
MIRQINTTTLEIAQGDITERDEDAIVNPANADLVLGAGVAGAIRAKGGPNIQAECNRKGPVHVGEAVITTGGDLKARFVIHAVGPMWGEGDEDNKLRTAVYRALRVADQNGMRSVAMPAISTGVFGFPMTRAAEIILDTIVRYVANTTPIKKIVVVLYDRATFDTFTGMLEGMEAAGVLPTKPTPPRD